MAEGTDGDKFQIIRDRYVFFALYKDDEDVGRHYFVKNENGKWIGKENKPFLRVNEDDDLVFDTFSSILKEVLCKSMDEIDLSEKVRWFTMKFE